MPQPTAKLALETTVTDGAPAMVLVDRTSDLEDVREWFRLRRGAVREALHIHGSLLFRETPVRDVHGFGAVRDALFDQPAVYQEKATPRSELGAGVFSSTDMPATHPIRLHNENSYTLNFPGLLLFGCLVAPEQGGATPVADCRDIYRRLDPALVDRFRNRGWSLLRAYHRHVGLPWRTAFGTDSRETVAGYCDESLVAYRWLDGDGLRTSQRRSAVIRHPVTGEDVWFNHIAFWSAHSLDPEAREVLVASYGADRLPFDTAYGDGAPIPVDEIAVMNAAYDASLRRADWRPGDLLLVDNILTCHGREPYRGDRRIVVAMGEPVALADCSPSVPPAPGPFPG